MLVLHVLAVAATTAAVLLGSWQYGAWQSGRQDLAAGRVDAPARPLDQVLAADQPFPADGVGQPVALGGRWLPDATFYVADRALHGRRGVWAVTPVEVCAGGATSCAGSPAVLVVRGWAATPPRAPRPPVGPVRVTGWLQPGEGSAAGDPDPSDDVLPQLRLADAVQRVDQDLYGGYVIARTVAPVPQAGVPTGSTSGGSSRGLLEAGLSAVTPASLPEPPAFTSVRNLLYALEWWVFGGFAVFLWWRWCRDEVSRVTGVASGE